MKTSFDRAGFLLTVGGRSCLATPALFAADTISGNAAAAALPQPAVAAETPAATPAAPAKLPYGVEDVLKLSRAQISEDIILNYVQNSGTSYNLGAQDVIYLRNQGVSDRVVNAMLGQRQRAADAAAAEVVAQPAVNAAAPSAAAAPAPTYPEPVAGDTQAAPGY